MPQVRDVMTHALVAVEPQASLIQVAQAMRDNDVGDVLVVDQETETLVGLLTDRDVVVRGLARSSGANGYVLPDGSPLNAGAVCSREVVAVAPDAETSSAAELMQRHSVRRLPVVDNEQVVGVVTLGDVAILDDSDSALAAISDAPPNR